MLLKDLNDYSANTKWAKMEPGMTSSEVRQTMRSGSHGAKIGAEKAIGHGIAKMAKLFQYCSLPKGFKGEANK
jgi:hypothetical protein